MSVSARHEHVKLAANPPTALDIFTARCEARAMLFAIGDYTLHDAVDALQAAAVESGLVGEIGQDAVQEIMARAFAKVWS
jgi:hypothetical protein